ncbi:hypothetical protein QQG55_35610 [Brugia pahangi]
MVPRAGNIPQRNQASELGFGRPNDNNRRNNPSSSGTEKDHPRKNHAYPNIHRGVGIGQYRVETIHPADFSLNQKKRRRRSIPSDKRR